MDTKVKSKKELFTCIGDQPLSSKVYGLRLPQEMAEFVESLPKSERSQWLRETLVKGWEQEND